VEATNHLSDGLTVVIPCYNEAASLSSRVDQWTTFIRDRGWSLVLVDDGSTDATPTVLRSFVSDPAVRVLRHSINRGYGAALKSGIARAETTHVATMDADGQHNMEHVSQLYQVMLDQRPELVIGSRAPAATAQPYRRLGKALIRRLTRVLFGVEIRDLNSGLRIYRKSAIQPLLQYCPDTMAFADISVLLNLNVGSSIVEVPVEIEPRRSGQSTINTMTAVDTLIEILNIVMWFRPLRLLLPIALAVMLAGAVWSVPFLLAGRGLSSVALLLLLAGFQLGVLALLAEQLASVRRLQLPGVGLTELEAGEDSAGAKAPARDE
jgi:glycosyltransferase involved in cell wall biosynthesis